MTPFATDPTPSVTRSSAARSFRASGGPAAATSTCSWWIAALLPAVLALPAAGVTQSPTVGILEGRVLDAVTRTPIAGVRLHAGEVQVETGADGVFRLALIGAATLEVNAVGYVAQSLAASPTERRLEVLLVPAARFKETVEVAADPGAEPAVPTTLPVRPAEVLAVAGAAENVFRVLQALPGVAGTNEFDSRLSVRGGGPDQNLTVMDGVEIHNPYRILGLISAFNPETVSSFDLSAGAFSARYGDRLSSLLVIENRPGSATRALGGSAALSLTDGNVILEGAVPGRKDASWLVTGRRTYYDLFAERFVDSDLPSFADLQSKVVWDRRPGQRFVLFGLRSREKTDALFEGDRSGESGTFLTASRNDLVSATFQSTVGSRIWVKTIAAAYRNTEDLGVDATFRDDSRRSNIPDEFLPQLTSVAFSRDLQVRDSSLRQEVTYQWRGQAFDAGFEIHRLTTRLDLRISGDRNPSAANGSSVQGGAGLPDLLQSAPTYTRSGAWIQDRFLVGRRLQVEPGVRWDRSGINGTTTLSPRFAATFSLGPRLRLRAAAGEHTQSPGYEKLVQADYLVDLTDADSLHLENELSTHVLLGLERDLGSGVQARVEGYAKRFRRLIVGRLETEDERAARVANYDFPPNLAWGVPREAQVTTVPANEAEGHGYGFDLYLGRRAASAETRLSGWAAYTFGVARREVYGRTFPFDYDRRHALSLVGSLRVRPWFELAATARAASGFPRTPALGVRVSAVEDTLDLDGDGNRAENRPERDAFGRLVYTLDYGGLANLNSSRLPAFARVDLRATFRPRGARGRWLFYLDVINLLNRKNAGVIETTLVYDPASDRPGVHEERQGSIPFLPSFGVRFRF